MSNLSIEQQAADALLQAQVSGQAIGPIRETIGADNIAAAYNIQKINTDKRISLGMFSFDDENTLQDNFPDVIRNTKFRQVIKQNLVPNPRGQSFKSVYKNKSSDTQSLSLGNDQRERFFIPEGGWGYCTYDGVGVRMRTGSLYRGGDGRLFPNGDTYNDNGERVLYGKYIEEMPNGPELIASFEQEGGETQDPQNVIGYAGYYPYFFDYRIGRNQSNSLIRLQYNLITGSFFTENDPAGEYNLWNKFFTLNQRDSFAQSLGELPFPYWFEEFDLLKSHIEPGLKPLFQSPRELFESDKQKLTYFVRNSVDLMYPQTHPIYSAQNYYNTENTYIQLDFIYKSEKLKMKQQIDLQSVQSIAKDRAIKVITDRVIPLLTEKYTQQLQIEGIDASFSQYQLDQISLAIRTGNYSDMAGNLIYNQNFEDIDISPFANNYNISNTVATEEQVVSRDFYMYKGIPIACKPGQYKSTRTWGVKNQYRGLWETDFTLNQTN